MWIWLLLVGAVAVALSKRDEAATGIVADGIPPVTPDGVGFAPPPDAKASTDVFAAGAQGTIDVDPDYEPPPPPNPPRAAGDTEYAPYFWTARSLDKGQPWWLTHQAVDLGKPAKFRVSLIVGRLKMADDGGAGGAGANFADAVRWDWDCDWNGETVEIKDAGGAVLAGDPAKLWTSRTLQRSGGGVYVDVQVQGNAAPAGTYEIRVTAESNEY